MKLWIDDLREAPHGWLWSIDSADAITNLMHFDIDEVSFDHDLGDDDTTRKVILWMCENDVWPAICHVHTANPVGREWLVGMINRYGPGVS